MSLAAYVDAALARAAIVAIEGYQKHLSPRKGYACAPRVAHGGTSCSQYIKQVVAASGLDAELRALRPRFRDCHAASLALKAAARVSDGAAGPSDESADGPTTKKGRKAQGCSSSLGNFLMSGCAEGCCDASDLGQICQG